jgi:type I restriction enzyme, S subunit
MSDLPRRWAEASLGELGAEVRGSVSASAGVTYELYSVPTFPTGRPEIVDASTIGSSKRPVQPGDVLLCKINPRINRVWQVREPSDSGHVQLASTEYLVLRVSLDELGRYLVWYLRSPSFREWIKLSVEGATGSHTRAKSGPILRRPIPVPPLDEQRRIVAAIEEHLSRLDAADTSLAAASQRLAGLRRSALMDGFNGAWPTVELREATDPVRPICYGILKPKTTGNLEVPYVEVRSIKNGRVDVDSLHCTTRALHEEFKRSELRAGDVVLAIRGSFDRAAVVPPQLEGANVSRDVARVAPLSQLDSGYLAHYLGGPAAFGYFAAAARGVGVRGVNIGDLRTMPIPLPPLEEQRRIVAVVEERLSAIDALRAAIERAQRRSAALRRSVLERAFRGELVPQDPSDESAEALLARIRAEAAIAAKPAGR